MYVLLRSTRFDAFVRVGGGVIVIDLLVRFILPTEIHIVCILFTARCSMIVHFLNKVLSNRTWFGVVAYKHKNLTLVIFLVLRKYTPVT